MYETSSILKSLTIEKKNPKIWFNLRKYVLTQKTMLVLFFFSKILIYISYVTTT